jgi:hypothetical protein
MIAIVVLSAARVLLAVTSLNRLLADSLNALRDDIGIFVEMNQVADVFVRRFEHAKAIG